MAATPADAALRSARTHARWRWTGAPLLATGGVLLILAILGAMRSGPISTVMLSIFGCGLSLASFGANHEAAVVLALRARDGGVTLPDALAGEVKEEMARDRTATLALRASPKIALVLPLVAVVVQSLVVWRLLSV
jgi:hypothetical protein